MRAVYNDFGDVELDDNLIISGEAAHHLNVVRVKLQEIILLMNGKGVVVRGEIQAISKNIIEIKINQVTKYVPQHELSLAIANPKKDAFEDILKSAVELGIKHVFPLSSDFSQYNYLPSDRIQRVLESALIQSNNPFFPVIHEQQTLVNFLNTHTNTIAFFNSKNENLEKESHIHSHAKTILIGPEGGFSPKEVTDILNYSSVEQIHLATPIMRAPTAVASSVGYLLANENGPK